MSNCTKLIFSLVVFGMFVLGLFMFYDGLKDFSIFIGASGVMLTILGFMGMCAAPKL